MKNKKIGFIGTGVMGRPIVEHLLSAGYTVAVSNRTPAKAKPLIEAGALWTESVEELAGHSDIVFTMLGYPDDVKSIYLGDDGLIQARFSGKVYVDLTTSSPLLAQTIYEAGKESGISCLDAPVSGGEMGAQNGSLSIMIGGDEVTYNYLLPFFEVFGKTIKRQGGAGKGQFTKMANQIAIASGMLGVCEALAFAQKAGLNPETVMESIETGAAGSWSLTNLGRKMLAGNFAPGFYVKHFIKDMGIAIESAKELGITLPGLELTLKRYQELAQAFGGEEGTQALYRLYQ